MPDFRIIRFLSSIFTPDLSITNSLKFLNVVAELLGEKLDGDPIILPIPQDAPAEIPRIQLKSSDNKWGLDMTLARTNLFYNNPLISSDEIVKTEEFSSISSSFLSEFQKKLDLRVQRIAFITERVLPEEDAPSYITDKFCKEELRKEKRPFNNVKKFEIHSLKKYPWEDFHLNSWIRIKSIDLKSDEIIPVILLLNDLNTLSDEEDPERAFSPQDIIKFFQKTPKHINEILTKYSF